MLGLSERDRFKDLPPNKPVCGCKKHAWYVSQRVMQRPLTCPLCRRQYVYESELNGGYALYYRGRFKTKREIETRLEDYGKEAG
jgi:hypothetical protein